MSIYETSHGNAYANDPDYDAFTGYVTKTYQTEWRDKQGNLWRKTCTVINLGRPDAVTPKQGDESLVPEYLPGDDAAMQRSATIAANRDNRHNAIRLKLVEYLKEHGPTPIRQLGPIAGYKDGPQGSLAEHFAYYPDVYQRFCNVPAVWGLVGQTYMPPTLKRDLRLRDALLEHGPLTEKDLCKVSGIYHTDAQRGLKGNPEMFAIVGYKSVLGQKISRLWGVVGVHDKVAA